MLKVTDLHVNYGMIQAIKGVDFHVDEGEIIALIGANGAGKTTILNRYRSRPRQIRLNHLRRPRTHQSPRPQNRNNGHEPRPRRTPYFPGPHSLRQPPPRRLHKTRPQNVPDTIKQVYAHFPRLEERKNQIAGTLSGGEQQMLAIGRALMSLPKIILMDEPSMGLSPLYVSEIFNIIKEINKAGTTVLLVEQNAKKALSIANRAYVLETGNIVLEGDAKELMQNDRVKKAYLGE
ncbi:MAG: ABC transporter ATP-binding protein [Eubacteriales bacterium]